MKPLAPRKHSAGQPPGRPSSAKASGHDFRPGQADMAGHHRPVALEAPSAVERASRAGEKFSHPPSGPRTQNALAPSRRSARFVDIKACDRWMRQTKIFCAPDFAVSHLRDALRKGLNFEIGGPTKAYQVLGSLPIANGPNVVVSNAFVDQGSAAHQEGLLADGRSLPVRAGSFDTVWASAFPDADGIRSGAIKEAWRTLRPGGFFVWQGSTARDMKEASDAGFQIAHYTLSGEKGNVEEIFLTCGRAAGRRWPGPLSSSSTASASRPTEAPTLAALSSAVAWWAAGPCRAGRLGCGCALLRLHGQFSRRRCLLSRPRPPAGGRRR